MRGAIRHLPTAEAIALYIGSADRALRASRIEAYMQLMHFTLPNTTRQALIQLARKGKIQRLRADWYRSYT